VPEEDLGPLRDDGAVLRRREAREAGRKEGPLPLLLPEELRDAGSEAGGQGRPPGIRRRASISTVRSQSL